MADTNVDLLVRHWAFLTLTCDLPQPVYRSLVKISRVQIGSLLYDRVKCRMDESQVWERLEAIGTSIAWDLVNQWDQRLILILDTLQGVGVRVIMDIEDHKTVMTCTTTACRLNKIMAQLERATIGFLEVGKDSPELVRKPFREFPLAVE